MSNQSWFVIREPLKGRRRLVLWIMSFLMPLGLWSLVSYCPYVYHPMVMIEDPGGVDYFQADMLLDRELFDEENAAMAEAGLPLAVGAPANPIFLPAPHQVGTAFFRAFKTPPVRRGEPWLHESLLHSIRVIAWAFILSAILGVPLGIACGTFDFANRLIEPFVDFVRYMPAPAFGALAVAVAGINDAPKVTIIFIGTFFQMVLVVSGTTRNLDRTLLEAAQTLGARGIKLVTRVVVPGILPQLYRDLRILLGWAWTYLIVAELIGASSGISYFINQQAKYRNYDNVYAAIIMIGLIGLSTDVVLAYIGKFIFPWEGRPVGWVPRLFAGAIGAYSRRIARLSALRDPMPAQPSAIQEATP